MTTKLRTKVEEVEHEVTVCDGCGVEDEPTRTLAVNPRLDLSEDEMAEVVQEMQDSSLPPEAALRAALEHPSRYTAEGRLDVCASCCAAFFDAGGETVEIDKAQFVGDSGISIATEQGTMLTQTALTIWVAAFIAGVLLALIGATVLAQFNLLTTIGISAFTLVSGLIMYGRRKVTDEQKFENGKFELEPESS